MKNRSQFIERYVLRPPLICYQIFVRYWLKIGVSQNRSDSDLNIGNFQFDNNGFMTAYFGNVQYLYAKCRKSAPSEIENFVDVGSGDGAVAYFMARKFPKLRCYGIEIDSSLHDLAMNHISDDTSNLRYLHISALDWNFELLLKNSSVLFFFNSFGKDSLRVFLTKLMSYSQEKDVTLYFIYLNDVHRELFEERGIKNVYLNKRKQSIWQISQSNNL